MGFRKCEIPASYALAPEVIPARLPRGKSTGGLNLRLPCFYYYRLNDSDAVLNLETGDLDT